MKPVNGGAAVPRGQPVVGIRMGEVDRFLVPLDDASILEWFFKHLFVAHNLRERLLALTVSPAAVARGGSAGFDHCWMLEPQADGGSPRSGAAPTDAGWADILVQAGEATVRALQRLGDGRLDVHPSRCIFLRDYRNSGRRMVLVFAFADGGRRPAVVVKVRPGTGDCRPLRHEWLTLSRMRRRLPPGLRGRLPKPLGFETWDGVDVLVMTPLAGRSGYVELYQGLDPSRFVARHFAAAADWLAGFQLATRQPNRCYRPDEDPMLGEAVGRNPTGLRWLDQLVELTARRPPPLCASHGDFWARNLVLPRSAAGLAGVVDWEHGSAEASPFFDLLHFLLTYGLDYPWSRYRRRRITEAFRLTCLERNCVSEAAQEYLRQHCERTATDPALLLPAAHLHLLALAHRSPPPQRAPWRACQRLLQRAATSVFSA